MPRFLDLHLADLYLTYIYGYNGLQEQISNPAGSQNMTPSPYQASENVSICPDCQGSRVEVQLYNHRQLEVQSFLAM